MNVPANAPAQDARKRVLFVDHATALGGAELSLLMLLERMDHAQWEPHLACYGGALAERARALGISVHVTPLSRLRRSWRAPVDLAAGARALAGIVRPRGPGACQPGGDGNGQGGGGLCARLFARDRGG
mgnify:CR=1 FL=1